MGYYFYWGDTFLPIYRTNTKDKVLAPTLDIAVQHASQGVKKHRRPISVVNGELVPIFSVSVDGVLTHSKTLIQLTNQGE